MTRQINPTIFWIIVVAAVVLLGGFVYWYQTNQVPAPQTGVMREQGQAAQRAASARVAAEAAAKAAAGAAARAAALEAAKAANPLLVENPVAKAGSVKLKLR